MKILMFTDIHVYPHRGDWQRVDFATESIKRGFELFKKHNCDYVFILGDIEHDKEKLEKTLIRRIKECFPKNMKDKIFIIAGNHDFKNSVDDALLYLDDVATIFRKPTKIQLDGYDFLMHPYSELVDFQLADFFCGHIEMQNAYDTEKHLSEKGISPEELQSKYEASFLGHYHVKKIFNDKIFCLGSVLETRPLEGGEHGYYIFDFHEGFEIKFIPNEAPSFIKTKIDDLKEENVKGNFVSITISAGENAEKVRERILEMGAIGCDIELKSEDVFVTNSTTSIASVNDILKTWMNEVKPKTNDTFRDVFKEVLAKSNDN